MEIFDEDKAVEFIKAELEKNEAVDIKYTNDDLLEVIDLIWDFYEDNGFLDLDMAEDGADENADINLITQYVTKMITRDKGSKIRVQDIPFIIEAELAYEATLE